jgi:hypothetical protein
MQHLIKLSVYGLITEGFTCQGLYAFVLTYRRDAACPRHPVPCLPGGCLFHKRYQSPIGPLTHRCMRGLQ